MFIVRTFLSNVCVVWFMKKEFFGITCAAFQSVYFFPLLVCVLVLLYYAVTKKEKWIRLLVHKKWEPLLLKHFSYKKNRIKAGLFAIAACFLFIGLLRPQWGEKEQKVAQEGRELFIGLDISRSMLAADVKPDRLTFAKSKIKRLLQLLPAERVGLVVFSGAAVVQCPLTRDTSAFNLFLDQVDVESISSGTTSLEKAIAKTIKTFSGMPARKNKLLVLFTDGEDFSTDLAPLRKEAQEMGLHIFTYGVGTEQGAPIPVIDDNGKTTGYEKNEQGNAVISRLNPGILQSLARETQGKYIAPTQEDDDLKQLISYVEGYEKEAFEDKELTTQEDQYPYFLFISFVCLVLEWLL